VECLSISATIFFFTPTLDSFFRMASNLVTMSEKFGLVDISELHILMKCYL